MGIKCMEDGEVTRGGQFDREIPRLLNAASQTATHSPQKVTPPFHHHSERPNSDHRRMAMKARS
ncbi:MAG: hypothetical protein QOH85_1097 [Acidobacteriaceae bacterium]|nr:hypothetical protein [Acidobacteriaceae bacterium]